MVQSCVSHQSFGKLQYIVLGFYGVSGIHLIYEVFCDESDSFVINAKLLIKIPKTVFL